MSESSANPLWVTLICVARCAVPLLLMLGVTYLLKRLGLIAEPAHKPPETENGEGSDDEGGMAHGEA